MAKFKFNLQTVLKLKEQLEQNAKNNLGKATKVLEQEEKALEELFVYKEELIKSFKEKSKQGTNVQELINHNNYLLKLNKRIKNQNQNVDIARRNVDKQRQVLVEASREKKVLEKLREKKFEEYMKEEYKKEQKITDEIVSYKYSQKDSEG